MKRQKRKENKKKGKKILILCLDFNSLCKDKFQLYLVLLILTFHNKLTWLKLDQEFQNYLNEHSLNTMKNVKEKALSSTSGQTNEISKSLLKSSVIAETANKYVSPL